AFATHCCAGSPPPRSRWIAGSATLTIVPSIVATPEPRIAARRVSLCLRLTPASSDDERDLVDVAPAPVLARLRRAGDRVARLGRVTRGVAIRRGVAAADLPAGLAHPQVNPPGADLQALLAAGDRLRQLGDPDLVEVRALRWSRHTSSYRLPGWPENARAGDGDRVAAEIGSGELPHQVVRRGTRVGPGDAGAGDRDRDELPRNPARVAVERHLEDRAHAGDALRIQRPVPDEVAERVRDQPPAVPLHPAQDVGTAADDEVGAGADDGVRERERVAAVLAEEPLRPGADVEVRRTLCAGVHRHHYEVGPDVRLPDEGLRRGEVQQALRPGVRREADDRNAGAADDRIGDLSRTAGGQEPGGPHRGDGVR